MNNTTNYVREHLDVGKPTEVRKKKGSTFSKFWFKTNGSDQDASPERVSRATTQATTPLLVGYQLPYSSNTKSIVDIQKDKYKIVIDEPEDCPFDLVNSDSDGSPFEPRKVKETFNQRYYKSNPAQLWWKVKESNPTRSIAELDSSQHCMNSSRKTSKVSLQDSSLMMVKEHTAPTSSMTSFRGRLSEAMSGAQTTSNRNKFSFPLKSRNWAPRLVMTKSLSTPIEALAEPKLKDVRSDIMSLNQQMLKKLELIEELQTLIKEQDIVSQNLQSQLLDIASSKFQN